MTRPSKRTVDRSSKEKDASNQPKPKSFWILGPYADMSLVIGSPLIVYALITVAQMQWSTAVVSSLVMIWAIGHHLPGMMRAYGDPELFSRFKIRFIVAPLSLLGICFWSFSTDMNGIHAVAGVWGWWHYLMQTYGFVRIYDAKVGAFANTTRWIDWLMCVTWFGAAILLNDNALFGFITNFYNAGIPTPSAEVLVWAKSAMAVFLVLVNAAFVFNWGKNLQAGIRPNPVKLLLMFSSFACFWYSTATVTRIVVAYAFFELFHDIQYLTIVWAFNQNRVKKDSSLGGFTHFLFRPRFLLVLLYILLVFAYGSLNLTKQLVSPGTLQQFLFSCFLASALLHFYFDGFIWKLKEKKTQSSLGIEGAGERRGILSRLHISHAMLWTAFAAIMIGLTYAESSKKSADANDDGTAVRERAALESEKWAEMMPNSFKAHFYAGLVHEERGDYPLATEHYLRALAILPEYGDAINGLNRIRAATQNPNAPRPNNSQSVNER